MTVQPQNVVKSMPAQFLGWQCEERRHMFSDLQRGKHPSFLASHLPVVSTLTGSGAMFPIHSTTKGVGLLPRSEYLEEHIEQIDACLEGCRKKTRSEGMSARIEAALALYDHPDRIDSTVFGGIEIFRNRTYRNLVRDSRATLLFTGPGPQYLSYQFNCIGEIVGPEDQRFQFLLGMRRLFDSEHFHIRQPQYPFGYLFRIQELFDKTPHRVPEDKTG